MLTNQVADHAERDSHSAWIPTVMQLGDSQDEWAARYNTGLLNTLTPKGVVFSLFFLFFSDSQDGIGTCKWQPKVTQEAHAGRAHTACSGSNIF